MNLFNTYFVILPIISFTIILTLEALGRKIPDNQTKKRRCIKCILVSLILWFICLGLSVFDKIQTRDPYDSLATGMCVYAISTIGIILIYIALIYSSFKKVLGWIILLMYLLPIFFFSFRINRTSYFQDLGLALQDKSDDTIILSMTNITDHGLRHLPKFHQLESLRLARTNITDEGIKYLKELKTLKKLYLGSTRITDTGLVYLKDLTNLEELNLSRTQITDAGLAHLVKLHNLSILKLNNTDITSKGLVHLSELNKLRWLDLENTRIDDDAIEHLVSLKELRILSIMNTDISKNGYDVLRNTFPDGLIHNDYEE